MKILLLFLSLAGVLLAEEDIALAQNVILRADRTMISIKAGTIVTLVSRDDKTATIRYKDVTGTIPASKLTASAAPAEAKKDAPDASRNKPSQPQNQPTPQNPPQTNYGKAVQKAKDNAAKHEKNLVKPTDDPLKEN